MPFTASSLCIGRSFSSTQRKTRARPAISSNASVTRLFIPLLPGGVTCQDFSRNQAVFGRALFARSAVNFDFRVLVEGAFRAAFRVESQILGFDAFGIDQLALVSFKEFPVGSHAQA